MSSRTIAVRGLYPQDISSASYKAHREDDGRFTLLRMPHKKYATVPLLGAPTEEVAQCLLDWFVSHDHLVQRVLELDSEDALFSIVMEAVNGCVN